MDAWREVENMEYYRAISSVSQIEKQNKIPINRPTIKVDHYIVIEWQKTVDKHLLTFIHITCNYWTFLDTLQEEERNVLKIFGFWLTLNIDAQSVISKKLVCLQRHQPLNQWGSN